MSQFSTKNSTNLLREIFDLGVIKFGEFVLKTGIVSPVYVTFRNTISDPNVLQTLSQCISKAVRTLGEYESWRVCGVPYGALSLATLVSVECQIPLLICRKEGAKSYGTKQRIEGLFKPAEEVVIVDDVLTSGTSILEVASVLREEGLVVKHAIVLLDRCQGGIENLANHGIVVRAVFSLPKVIKEYFECGLISEDMEVKVKVFLEENNHVALLKPTKFERHSELPWSQRLQKIKHPIGKRLLDTIIRKKTNLCVAADCTDFAAVLKLATTLGPHICALKVHADFIEDFPPDGGARLAEIAKAHNFLLFEDRKFGDIGSTVGKQYQRAAVEWADLVTAHGVAGPGTIEALRNVLIMKACAGDCSAPIGARGVLLVAEMSSEGTLAKDHYKDGVVAIGKQFPDFVVGFICQSGLDGDPSFCYWTPGVKISEGGDSLGQQYKTPETAIAKGADVIIVGRGILEAVDPVAEAVLYKTRGFEALMARGIAENPGNDSNGEHE